jgi:nitrite reductase/ring-hydroxylating ferredoxin subunit
MNETLIQLCPWDDIPEGSSKGFTLKGIKLFAVKHQGQCYLYRNTCPHLGIPLEWDEHQFLDSSGTLIRCANHGALFVIDSGQCVTGTCAGRSLEPIQHSVIGQQICIVLP